MVVLDYTVLSQDKANKCLWDIVILILSSLVSLKIKILSVKEREMMVYDTFLSRRNFYMKDYKELSDSLHIPENLQESAGIWDLLFHS